jgi:autotransporter adhesin
MDFDDDVLSDLLDNDGATLIAGINSNTQAVTDLREEVTAAWENAEAYMGEQMGFDSTTQDFKDVIGQEDGTNLAGVESVSGAINALDDVIGDMSLLTDRELLDGRSNGHHSDVTSLAEALAATEDKIDGMIYRHTDDGLIHIGANSVVIDDVNHTIGTSTGEAIDMISSADANSDFTLGATGTSGLKINGQYAATQDYVQQGFAQVYSDMENGFRGINARIDSLDSELDTMGAQSAAMASLVPNARSAGNTQISMGMGAYGDAQAAAIGAFHYINNGTLLNFKASYGYNSGYDKAGKFQVGAGVTFGF